MVFVPDPAWPDEQRKKVAAAILEWISADFYEIGTPYTKGNFPERRPGVDPFAWIKWKVDATIAILENSPEFLETNKENLFLEYLPSDLQWEK